MKKLITYGVLFFIGTLIVSTVIHEAGHAVAALLLGVPISEIKIGFYGISPSVTIPERFGTMNLAPVHYAGGFGSGFALLILYTFLFLRYLKKPSFLHWSLGFITMLLSGFQLSCFWQVQS